MLRKLVLVAALLLAVPAVAAAQSLSTAPPNNGSGGVFLSLTPVGAPLNINSFEVPFSSAAGTPVQVEVWTRPGPYTGFTASSAGWTLLETANAVSAGSTTWAPLVLSSPIALSGETSVYLHAITVGGGIRYTGTGTGGHQLTWGNGDLTLFSDTTRTGAVSFAGTQFTPRTFSGVVNYTAIPEPAAGLCIAGLAGLALRRRRA